MNVFDVADMLDAAGTKAKRDEIVRKYLEPIDFPQEAERSAEIGYRFYGIMDGMVIFQVDGTWMIRDYDDLLKEMKEAYP